MNVILEKIQHKQDALVSLDDQLKQLVKSRDILDFKGHQKAPYVLVSDGDKSVRVNVSALDRGYTSRMKKGHDMILLGMKRVLNESISDKKEKILAAKLDMKNLSIELLAMQF